MTTTDTPTIERLADPGEAELTGLADVLIDCVDGGASVHFMRPLARTDALAFWQRVAAEVRGGERALLVARDEAGIAGTVQLILAMPPNQPHRAELAKMLVHRRARQRGVGEALMRAAEALAHERGRTLLVLDTASETAARLYARCGWTAAGSIPGFALLPDGGLCATTFFWKALPAGSSG